MDMEQVGAWCRSLERWIWEGERTEMPPEALETLEGQLPRLRQLLELDLQAALECDPAAVSREEIRLAYPGFRAVEIQRLAHILWLRGIPLLPRLMTSYAHRVTGIDIHPGAEIGKSFFIDHGTGVVIGETARIGDQVKLYQGVTLGALSTRNAPQLRGKKRHPTLGDRVTVYANATILGGETVIGDDCTIGANVLLTESLSPGTVVRLKAPELVFSGK